jgi:hypothetical protein
MAQHILTVFSKQIQLSTFGTETDTLRIIFTMCFENCSHHCPFHWSPRGKLTNMSIRAASLYFWATTAPHVVRQLNCNLPDILVKDQYVIRNCKRLLETSERHLFITLTNASKIIIDFALRLAQPPRQKKLSNNQRTAFPNYITAARVICTRVEHSARDCRIVLTLPCSFHFFNNLLTNTK